MSVASLRTRLEQAYARGLTVEQAARAEQCSYKAALDAWNGMAMVAAEDGPVCIPPISRVQRQRQRSRLLSDLDEEQRIVAANARTKQRSLDPLTAARRLHHAQWKRQYRARKGAA